MAYICDIGNAQQVKMVNQGLQTLITVSMSAHGQQQQASTGFTTGNWTTPPRVFRTGGSVVLEIDGEQGQFFVLVQGNGISTLNTKPSLGNADVLPLEKVPDQSEPLISPMSPMKPMEPMKMGNMEIQMNPMQMKMGNMEMQIGTPLSPPAKKNFCSQCGVAIGISDRFCTNCGQPLP